MDASSAPSGRETAMTSRHRYDKMHGESCEEARGNTTARSDKSASHSGTRDDLLEGSSSAIVRGNDLRETGLQGVPISQRLPGLSATQGRPTETYHQRIAKTHAKKTGDVYNVFLSAGDPYRRGHAAAVPCATQCSMRGRGDARRRKATQGKVITSRRHARQQYASRTGAQLATHPGTGSRE